MKDKATKQLFLAILQLRVQELPSLFLNATENFDSALKETHSCEGVFLSFANIYSYRQHGHIANKQNGKLQLCDKITWGPWKNNICS